MAANMGPYPSDDELLTGLRSAAGEALGDQFSVVSRAPLVTGTFPKEVVEVRPADGNNRRLFVKYASGRNHDDHGHRAGVAYESAVYQEILRPIGVRRPRHLGLYTGDGPGHEWLVLDFLDGARRLTKSRVPNVLQRAAEWLGRFHAACETLPRGPEIRCFDDDYYLGWVRRARSAAECVRASESLPDGLWRRVRDIIAECFREPETVAHNEYYPNNILVVDGEIHPVDWESTAVAPGELDLASLLEGWPPEVAVSCSAVYRNARWSGGCPDGHGLRLQAAHAYLHCRWLAREASKGRLSASNARFRRLRDLDGQFARVS
jgi:hypothetical protein